MTDWNPTDPDATRVYYDLGAWSFDQQAELAAVMADADVPHAWDGTELMVPEEFEARADVLIAEVEARLGIDSEALADGYTAESDEGFEVPLPIALGADVATTEYDLGDWSATELDTVSNALAEARIAFGWEGQVLLVSTDDEAVVDALLDEIESGEYIDTVARPPTVDEEISAEVLTTFFLAAERLRRNPLDADGLERLIEATSVAVPESPPFGVSPKLWSDTCELAEQIVDALVDDDNPDPVGVVEAAERLHELLRPNV
jgi:hypothetical protein